MLEPVRAGKTVSPPGSWTEYLVLFLRIMAGVSLVKGLYHWAQVCGIGAPPTEASVAYGRLADGDRVLCRNRSGRRRRAVARRRLGRGRVAHSSVVSMAVVEMFFPQVYGGSVFVVLVE